jgi:predicted metal-dependent hydrolase
VQWRRSGRARRVGLRIDTSAGQVIVTLPPRATRREGAGLLETHADWVVARLAALPPLIAFADGADIPVAGRRTRIRHRAEAVGPARLQHGDLVVGGAAADLAFSVGAFLQTQARLRFGALVAKKGRMAGVRPDRIRLKDMRTRWGSCSADRTLTFNWRIVMAPPFVQDYVVAHEVAHLRHMNHGPMFQALEHELSRFGEPARCWLHRHGPSLLRTG